MTREQLQCLEGQRWLNDEVINFYLQLVVENNRLNVNLPNLFAFSTHIYPTLVAKGIRGVANWTKNVDLFSQDFIFNPKHLEVYWCLAVVDVKCLCINY